jgi:hypothetical protein
MKKTLLFAALLVLLLTINSAISTVFAQGTAFTYQGQLSNGGGFGTTKYYRLQTPQ